MISKMRMRQHLNMQEMEGDGNLHARIQHDSTVGVRQPCESSL